MNRRWLIENLIYVVLTSVQLLMVPSTVFAAPSMEPSIENVEPGHPPIDNSGAPKIDSLSISEPTTTKPRPPPHWLSFMERKVSLVTGLYLGPHQDEAFKTLLLFGLDLQVPIDPSDKWRGTVVISETTSPLITLARERYLRNYWVYLKSWQPVLQLELDSVQGFSGFFALNYYRFGAGLTFSWTDETELSLNFLPMSSRGVSGEIIFKYLAF